MSNKLVFCTGILGVTFFGVASFLGGFQFDNYNPISQYISETMAVGTPYGKVLRFFGYIPSGILLTIFGFTGLKKLPKSNLTKIGFWGIGVFYGIATIIVGLFPCDKGCNKELVDPSISQVIHNLTGLLTYIFVPISIIIIGVGLRQSKKYDGLSKIAFFCGLICLVFIGLLLSDPLTNFAGLFQRIIEGIFIIWIIACSIFIKRSSQLDINKN
jgi:putative Mn2+ efflux pump MntP